MESQVGDGVLPGLADDQVGPLHDDDGDEEGGVAGVLKDLPVRICPLLTVGVGQIVDSNGVPGSAKTKKVAWPETILTENDKVDEEASRGLDHPDLAVGHGDQTLVDELVRERVPWRSLHDVRLSLLVGHRDGGHHVRAKVDAEDGDGAKGQGHVSQDEEEEGGDLRDVGGQSVSDGLLQVIEDQSALLNTSHNGGKVVVEQDHVSGLLGDVGAGDTHGNTDVGLLQGRRVVDTISGDGNDGAHPLATLHNNQLLLGRSSGKDDLVVVHQDLVEVHVLNLASVDDGGPRLPGVDVLHTAVPPGRDVLDGFLALGDDSHRSSDGFSSDWVVAGHHDDL